MIQKGPEQAVMEKLDPDVRAYFEAQQAQATVQTS